MHYNMCMFYGVLMDPHRKDYSANGMYMPGTIGNRIPVVFHHSGRQLHGYNHRKMFRCHRIDGPAIVRDVPFAVSYSDKPTVYEWWIHDYHCKTQSKFIYYAKLYCKITDEDLSATFMKYSFND